MASNSPSMVLPRSRSSQHKRRHFPGSRLVWGGLVRILQRIARIKRSDKLEFKLSFSVRDLVSEKSRAVLDQVEALVRAVQKAGSYEAREEAMRAVVAVLDGLKGRVPPEVLSRLSEAAPVREVARLGRAAVQRFQKESEVSGNQVGESGGSDQDDQAPSSPGDPGPADSHN